MHLSPIITLAVCLIVWIPFNCVGMAHNEALLNELQIRDEKLYNKIIRLYPPIYIWRPRTAFYVLFSRPHADEVVEAKRIKARRFLLIDILFAAIFFLCLIGLFKR